MGEGKSTALAWSALFHTRHNPGASWALIRDTYENIIGTTQKTFFQWFPPGVYGDYNASKKTFTWASGIAKGDVVFMGMDDQQDATKLMSRELAGFGIDEPAPAVGSAGVSEMIFDMALSRLRQPGMNWYAAKLAENNPDEAHWTYKRFVQPGTLDFMIWQPQIPENVMNLPKTYYEELRRTFAHNPALVRRFVDGEFGFQAIGKAVTPEWSDKLHLSLGLTPLPQQDLIMLWDFGHNPTCIITQRTPLGHWLVLDAHTGTEIATEELINDWARPILNDRYRGLKLKIRHIGDPAGNQREQTSIKRSAVKLLKQEIGGHWKSGPVSPDERIPHLRAALKKTVGGKGMIQVDRDRCPNVWQALRGGWHYNIARTGLVSGVATKDDHSHPGDAMSYGAAVLFPLGKQKGFSTGTDFKLDNSGVNGYFNSDLSPREGAARVLARSAPPAHGAPL